jgi:hypothetical protein
MCCGAASAILYESETLRKSEWCTALEACREGEMQAIANMSLTSFTAVGRSPDESGARRSAMGRPPDDGRGQGEHGDESPSEVVGNAMIGERIS